VNFNRRLLGFTLFFTLLPYHPLPASELSLTVNIGDQISDDLLISCPLSSKQEQLLAEQSCWNVETNSGNWPAQLVRINRQAQLVFRQPPGLIAGKPQTFQLRPLSDPPSGSVRVLRDENTLQVVRNQSPLLVYHTQPVLPEGVSPEFQRSGHIHPLYSPAGVVVSDDFAPDHRHQHGLFFAWVNTQVGDQQVDFWNQAKQQGTVRHVDVLDVSNGPVTAAWNVALDHIMFEAGAERSVLSETWTVLAHPAEGMNLLEFISVQENVTEEIVTLNQYHYGGFALRANRNWLLNSKSKDKVTVQLRTDAHDNRDDGNHTSANWVSIHGPLSSQPDADIAGAAILGHTANRNAPQPVRLHPQKPYFCFCPVVNEPIVLKPGEKLESRYLVATFDHAVDPERMNQLSAAYAQPPRVELRINGK